jgi:hypothetical protein
VPLCVCDGLVELFEEHVLLLLTQSIDDSKHLMMTTALLGT